VFLASSDRTVNPRSKVCEVSPPAELAVAGAFGCLAIESPCSSGGWLPGNGEAMLY
jgi:hypothetical protein